MDYIYNLSGQVFGEFSPDCGYDCWSVGYVYLNGVLMALYTNGTTYFVQRTTWAPRAW
jgi:hypothetical protein